MRGLRALENLTHQLRALQSRNFPFRKQNAAVVPFATPLIAPTARAAHRETRKVWQPSAFNGIILFAIGGGGYAASHETYTKKCHALAVGSVHVSAAGESGAQKKTEPLSLLLLYKIVSPHPSYIVYIMFFSSGEASSL